METIGLMVRLPAEVKNWLADAAKKDDRSMNGMLISILKERMAKTAENEKTLTSAGKQ